MNYFRKSVLALMLATLASNAMADDVITLSTSKPVGEKMTLMVNPIGEISIAWGDDVFITYPTTDQPFRILESELKGQTITIKAADNRITMVNGSNQEVTSIDVTQAPNLRSLYCHNNKLEKVALSKADKLTDLDLSKNTFSSTKITVTAKTHPMMEAINLADNDFGDLSGDALKKAISDSIRTKDLDLKGQMVSGTIRDSHVSFTEQEGIIQMTGQYSCVEMIGFMQRLEIGDTNGEDNGTDR